MKKILLIVVSMLVMSCAKEVQKTDLTTDTDEVPTIQINPNYNTSYCDSLGNRTIVRKVEENISQGYIKYIVYRIKNGCSQDLNLEHITEMTEIIIYY